MQNLFSFQPRLDSKHWGWDLGSIVYPTLSHFACEGMMMYFITLYHPQAPAQFQEFLGKLMCSSVLKFAACGFWSCGPNKSPDCFTLRCSINIPNVRPSLNSWSWEEKKALQENNRTALRMSCQEVFPFPFGWRVKGSILDYGRYTHWTMQDLPFFWKRCFRTMSKRSQWPTSTTLQLQHSLNPSQPRPVQVIPTPALIHWITFRTQLSSTCLILNSCALDLCKYKQMNLQHVIACPSIWNKCEHHWW